MKQFLSSKKGVVVQSIIFLVLTSLAVYVRWHGILFLRQDMKEFLLPWYNLFQKLGGFTVLRDTSFSNSTPPYQDLLALTTHFPVIPK